MIDMGKYDWMRTDKGKYYLAYKEVFIVKLSKYLDEEGHDLRSQVYWKNSKLKERYPTVAANITKEEVQLKILELNIGTRIENLESGCRAELWTQFSDKKIENAYIEGQKIKINMHKGSLIHEIEQLKSRMLNFGDEGDEVNSMFELEAKLKKLDNDLAGIVADQKEEVEKEDNVTCRWCKEELGTMTHNNEPICQICYANNYGDN